MTVYVEQVIIDNLVINHLLLFLVAKALVLPSKFWRIFLGSLTGTVFALVFPLFSLGGILLVVLKILLGMVIITITFEYKTLKKFILILFCFIIFTAVMGGVIFALLLAINPNVKLENGTFVYNQNIPIGLFVLLVAILTKLIIDAISYFERKQKLKQFEYDMTIFNKKKVIQLKVFLDTGNLMCDKMSGKSIIVISYKTFQKIFDIKTTNFLLGHYNIPNGRYINLTSAVKTMRMLVFEVDSVLIKTKEKEKQIDNAILGLAKTDFKLTLGCDAVIGRQLID